MTSWVKISFISWATAVPITGLVLLLMEKPFLHYIDQNCRRILANKRIFIAAIFALVILYTLSIRNEVTFDEYNYALGLRQGLYVGPNHFLSHLLSYLVFWPLRGITDNTLLIRQVLNIIIALLTIVILRRTILDVTQDTAMANGGSLFLGVTYGFWKFAVSGEVYPMLLCCWVLCVHRATKIIQANDSWANFFLLSVFSNLAVLSHDLGALMAPAFLATFIVVGGTNRWKWMCRYVVSGLVFFPLFQLLVAMCAGTFSLTGYLNHHLWYYFNPDVQSGAYGESVFKNIFIVAREGLYTMITSLESTFDWGSIAVYVAITVFLFGLYFYVFKALLHALLKKSVLSPAFILALFNWILIYTFCLFWRPNEELHHWLLPFTTMLIVFSVGKLLFRDGAYLFLLASILLLSGLMSHKMLVRTNLDWMNTVGNTDQIVFSHSQDIEVQMTYFRPQVEIVAGCEELLKAAEAGKNVFVDNGHSDCFYRPGFSLEPWPENAKYSVVRRNKL